MFSFRLLPPKSLLTNTLSIGFILLLLALGGACERENFVLETETEQPRPPVVIEEQNRFVSIIRPRQGDTLIHRGRGYAAVDAGFFAVVAADSTLLACGGTGTNYRLFDQGLSTTGQALDRPVMIIEGSVNAAEEVIERSLRITYEELRNGGLMTFTTNTCSRTIAQLTRRDERALVGTLQTVLFDPGGPLECSLRDSVILEVSFAQPVTPCG